MSFSEEIEIFRNRLAETVAFCGRNGTPEDPALSLRTTALEPEVLREPLDETTYTWLRLGGIQEEREMIARLADKRAELLMLAGKYPDTPLHGLGGGRLLLSDPANSDICGLSGPESMGFFDGEDIPPWDSWVWCAEEATVLDKELLRQSQEEYRRWWGTGFDPPESARYLLCWVPGSFVPLAQEGILVNPAECLFWASEYKERLYDTPFLRCLEAEGLLR